MAANAAQPSTIEIRRFQPGDAEAFRTLNEEWIVRYFHLEPKDHQVLGDPETYILKPGGAILMAMADGVAAGCCALQFMSEQVYEVSKMAVGPAFQGQGIGKQLLLATIEEGRRLGARRLYIETNAILTPAVTLYTTCGFRPVPADRLKPSPFARANVHLEMWLES
jgi:putative acetyltransferase